MSDLPWIYSLDAPGVEHTETTELRLKRRKPGGEPELILGCNVAGLVAGIMARDEEIREQQAEIEQLKAERDKAHDLIRSKLWLIVPGMAAEMAQKYPLLEEIE